MIENITDLIVGDLYLSAEEHRDLLTHTGASMYCRKGLLNEIEITEDAICAYWRNKPIHCHHRNWKFAPKSQLILEDAYYDVDASELIILPGPEHSEVHRNPENIAEDVILNGHKYTYQD